jgi:hypothetical protein
MLRVFQMHRLVCGFSSADPDGGPGYAQTVKEPTNQTGKLAFPSEWFAHLPTLHTINVKSECL